MFRVRNDRLDPRKTAWQRAFFRDPLCSLCSGWGRLTFNVSECLFGYKPSEHECPACDGKGLNRKTVKARQPGIPPTMENMQPRFPKPASSGEK